MPKPTEEVDASVANPYASPQTVCGRSLWPCVACIGLSLFCLAGALGFAFAPSSYVLLPFWLRMGMGFMGGIGVVSWGRFAIGHYYQAKEPAGE
jgi:hypothetical protein